MVDAEEEEEGVEVVDAEEEEIDILDDMIPVFFELLDSALLFNH